MSRSDTLAEKALPSSPSSDRPASIDPALMELVRQRIGAGKPVRRRLATGGRLHVDRPLPFLCVYRAPAGRPDLGTAALVRPQASHLVAPAGAEHRAEVARLVGGVVHALAESCGACLLLELWAGPAPVEGRPRVRIITPARDQLASTVSALAEALRAMPLPVGVFEVEVIEGRPVAPPGERPLLSAEQASHGGLLLIGLEVPPVYRSDVGGALYPMVLRALARELTQALQRCFFEFARVQTSTRPRHYHVLGRRHILRAVREIDAELADIERSFDFLLDVTPVNSQEAWEEFRASGRASAPALHYRMLAVDPELGKRRLYELPIETLEDPVLAMLLRDKRRELNRQLDLLEERDGPRFLPGSIMLYGGVEESLMAEAEAILAATAGRPAPPREAALDAEALAARARAELERYRLTHPDLASMVHLRDDVPSLVVSRGDLLVPRCLAVTPQRAEALIQHEIGTHVVTHANGLRQPLTILAGGLAGYEALQEGLALLAEHLTGGLDAGRLRLIAARVVAVRRVIDGASMPELFEELCRRHRLPARTAFGVALRVFRGGGLTKDAIYLRGLLQLLDHLAAGGAIEPLLVGKVAIEQVPLVEELLRREAIRPPALRASWLDAPGAADRLARARAGLRPLDLIETGGGP